MFHHTHTQTPTTSNSKWLEQQRHFLSQTSNSPEVGQVPCTLRKVPGHLLCNILGFALFYVYWCLNQARGNMAAVVPAITSDITTFEWRKQTISSGISFHERTLFHKFPNRGFSVSVPRIGECVHSQPHYQQREWENLDGHRLVRIYLWYCQ